MKYIPAAKSVLERLIYSVKGMLVLNNSPAAFGWVTSSIKTWKAKRFFHRFVKSYLKFFIILYIFCSSLVSYCYWYFQSVSSEPSTLPSSDVIDDVTNVSSDILDSDSNDDVADDDDT